MPALIAVLGGDTGPFRREMGAASGIASITGKRIVAELSATALHLENQMVAAKRAGTNWSGYAAELVLVRAQLAQTRTIMAATKMGTAAGGVAAAVAGSKIKGLSGIMSEFMVIIREIGRGNWSRIPGSISLLTQRMGLLKYILAPVGIALIAAGGAAFFLWRHFKNTAEAAKNFYDIISTTKPKFSELAEAMKQAAQETASFNDWMKELGNSYKTFADDVEIALKKLREEARLQRELAGEKGASPKKLAGMDIESLKKELNLITLAKLELGRILEEDKLQAQKAEDASVSADRTVRISTLGKQSKKMGEIVDAIQEKTKDSSASKFLEGLYQRRSVEGGSALLNPGARHPETLDHAIAEYEATLKNTVHDVTVGGKKFSMSLGEAEKAFNSLATEEATLAEKQRQLSKITDDKKKRTEADQAEFEKLSKDVQELSDDLALKEKYLPQIAGSAHRGGHALDLTEQQHHGAFIGGPAVSLLDVSRRMEKHLSSIDKNTKHSGSSTGSRFTGTRF